MGPERDGAVDVSGPAPPEPLRGAGVGIAVAVAGVLVIVYFTLFPFDVVSRGASSGEIARRFSLSPGQLWNPREVPANMLLFVPFGFGLGGVVCRRVGRRRALLLVVAAGVALSAAVEVVQSGWLLRQPSLRDIVANGVGAALGGWAWGRSSDLLRRRVGRPGSARSRAAWLAVGMLPGAALVLTTVALGHRAEPAGWDSGFALALGNEPAGGRPWRGSIVRVALADRRVSDGAVSDLLAGARLRVVAPAATLVDLDFVEAPEVPIGWRSAGPADGPMTFDAGGVRLRTTQWLVTDGAVADVSRRIDAADAFTVVLEASSGSRSQHGPARLITLSDGPDVRNLTLAQQGSDLVIRVRSGITNPNGRSPQFAIHGFFRDLGAHRLVLRYDGSRIDAAIDADSDAGSIELLPAVVPMLASFPDDIDRIRFSSFGGTARDLFFAIAVFGPWVVGVAACSGRPRWWGAAASVVPVPVVHVALAAMLPAQPFHAGRVAIVAAGAAALYLVSVHVLGPSRREVPVDGSPPGAGTGVVSGAGADPVVGEEAVDVRLRDRR